MRQNRIFIVQASASQQRGFALILCLVVLALLSVLSVAMLSFSRQQSQRASSQDWNSIARANARLALNLALAQLQETMGPDQRVSATASIFDSDPETVEIEGVANPEILGAWSTLDAQGKPIVYQTNDGFHRDSRDPNGTAKYDHKKNVLKWLVSASDPLFNPVITTLDDQNSVVLSHYLQDESSVGNPQVREVRAPMVSLRKSGDQLEQYGNYAYLVTDLGAAAPLAQQNSRASNVVRPSDLESFSNLYTGIYRPYDKLAETKSYLSHAASKALVAEANGVGGLSLRSFELSAASLSDTLEFFKRNYQRFTVSNSALFVDTINGGLKYDLSPYLKKGASGLNDTVIQDDTPLLTATRFLNFSPKFGALRSFANSGLTGKSLAPSAPDLGGGMFGDYPNPVKVNKQAIHPYIVEYSQYISVGANDNYPSGLEFRIFPRVTLWNPYNVKINSANYLVQINNRCGYDFQLFRRSTNQFEFYASYTNYPSDQSFVPDSTNYLNDDGTRALEKGAAYRLVNVSLEPGQAVTFMPPSSYNGPLRVRPELYATNVLVPTSNLSGIPGYFNVKIDGIKDPVTGVEKKYSVDFDPKYFMNRITFMGSVGIQAVLRLVKKPYNSLNAVINNPQVDNPIIHTFDMSCRLDEEDYHTRFDFRDKLMFSRNVLDPVSFDNPYNRTKAGGRLKAFAEIGSNQNFHSNNIWNYPLIESANLRSSFYRRHPWDWPVLSATSPHVWNANGASHGNPEIISFGPFTADEIEQVNYLDQFLEPRSNAVNENTPFQDPSNFAGDLRFPIFEVLPQGIDIYNAAQLRSANLTHEVSAPSFIVGESLATITSPRNQTAFDVAKYNEDWWNGLNEKNITNQKSLNNPNAQYRKTSWWSTIEQNKDQSTDVYNPKNHYSAFDYRYEVNKVLWDKYYFSTLKKVLLSNSSTPDLASRNAQFSNPFISAESYSNQNSPLSPASNARLLKLNNHHSVNSTNYLAWKALLAMNMGLEQETNDGVVQSQNNVTFPGLSVPAKKPTVIKDTATNEAWNSYQQFTDAQISELARNITAEVKRRAPFISLSDFVNRRLYGIPRTSETIAPIGQLNEPSLLLSYAGPLEVAIMKSNFNSGFDDYLIKRSSDYKKPSQNQLQNGVFVDVPRPATSNMPIHAYAGAPAYLTQGKVLQSIGSIITPRSDSFRISAYGDARDPGGRVMARVYCEAIVQRNIDYCDNLADLPEVVSSNLTSNVNRICGRRFKVISFRWLNGAEL